MVNVEVNRTANLQQQVHWWLELKTIGLDRTQKQLARTIWQNGMPNSLLYLYMHHMRNRL